jgi:hypothetical protein
VMFMGLPTERSVAEGRAWFWKFWSSWTVTRTDFSNFC